MQRNQRSTSLTSMTGVHAQNDEKSFHGINTKGEQMLNSVKSKIMMTGLSVAAIVLTGCGGGSGSSSTTATAQSNSGSSTSINPYITMDGIYSGTGVRDSNAVSMVAASVSPLYQGYLTPNSNYIVFYSSPTLGESGALMGVNYGTSGVVSTQFSEIQEGLGSSTIPSFESTGYMPATGGVNGGTFQGNYVADQYLSFNATYKTAYQALNVSNAVLNYVSGTNQSPSISALAGNYSFTVGPTQATASYYGTFSIDSNGNLVNFASTESAAATGSGSALTTSNCGITASLTNGGSAAYNVAWIQNTLQPGCPAMPTSGNQSVGGYAIMPNSTSLYLAVANVSNSNTYLVLQATKI